MKCKAPLAWASFLRVFLLLLWLGRNSSKTLCFFSLPLRAVRFGQAFFGKSRVGRYSGEGFYWDFALIECEGTNGKKMRLAIREAIICCKARRDFTEYT